MKLPRLPEIDLANNAPRSAEDKFRALELLAGKGSWSYAPARQQDFNIFHPTNPMGLDVDRPSRAEIVRAVERACKQADQLTSCVEVVKMLSAWREAHVEKAVENKLPGMAIGTVDVVRYWSNFVAIYEGRPTFFYFDYRRRNGLTKTGRRVVFSLMHEHIRATYPEFADAQLAVVQFPMVTAKKRGILVSTDAGVELFELADLQRMIAETYAVWRDVQLARRAAPQEKQVGGLFG